ncbi:MAG: molybdenum cofactor guanylyltransferase MobA [Burkholderiaceae bacterium]|nr:molybdenum cofactor guanylyltransferase MobA [Burkholderiaceae bacterium]
MIDLKDITGLVLAGGRGSRMGGLDKGLQLYRGVPLAQHALQRLAPQVSQMILSANRNLETYRSFGVPVWPDSFPDHAGPLAGFLSGLEHCTTWLLTVPCDVPYFPVDLVERMIPAIEPSISVAIAGTQGNHGHQVHPVFCLMHAGLRGSLKRFVLDGGRKVEQWIRQHSYAEVMFADEVAFANANTLDELYRLTARN